MENEEYFWTVAEEVEAGQHEEVLVEPQVWMVTVCDCANKNGECFDHQGLFLPNSSNAGVPVRYRAFSWRRKEHFLHPGDYVKVSKIRTRIKDGRRSMFIGHQADATAT